MNNNVSTTEIHISNIQQKVSQLQNINIVNRAKKSITQLTCDTSIEAETKALACKTALEWIQLSYEHTSSFIKVATQTLLRKKKAPCICGISTNKIALEREGKTKM